MGERIHPLIAAADEIAAVLAERRRCIELCKVEAERQHAIAHRLGNTVDNGVTQRAVLHRMKAATAEHLARALMKVDA